MMADADKCAACGEVIPEGIQVCPLCSKDVPEMGNSRVKIKELLGFCGVKGCNHRAYCTATLTAKRKQDGTPVKLGKRKLCEEHLTEVIVQATKHSSIDDYAPPTVGAGGKE